MESAAVPEVKSQGEGKSQGLGAAQGPHQSSALEGEIVNPD